MTLQHPHAELSAYIDDALDPAAQAAVDGHLVACALCRSHVAQLRATVAFVQALPDPVPSRRLVPRLAAPAWLVPLRTLMTLASGAAVFLFIASAVISNITFLTSGGATGTTAQEASRDTAAKVQAPAAAGPASTPSPAPVASGNVAFGLSPSASPSPDAARAPQGAATDDSRTRADQSTAGPAGAPGAAFNPQDAGRLTSSEPQRSLLNPWLWLALAIVCGGIAIALHRRLRAAV